MTQGRGEAKANRSRPKQSRGRRVRVLVIDDSAVVRQVMQDVLTRDPELEVTVAADPLIALKKIEKARPDVILLDLTMPRMDGFTFLKKLMAENPLPVVVCSAAVGDGTEAALRALDEGAVEVLSKPTLGVSRYLEESALSLIETVRAAATARVRRRGIVPPSFASGLTDSDSHLERGPSDELTKHVAETHNVSRSLIAVGASMGGPEALRAILEAMPGNAPALAVVLHMPVQFTSALASRLNSICQIEVKEAEDGDEVRQGRALIAPGDRHMRIEGSRGNYRVALTEGPKVSGHRPSVDVFLESVANSARSDAVGVILTGMGKDGAKGLLEMRKSGALTLAEDKESCVVFGMPRRAIDAGAVSQVLSLGAMPRGMLDATGFY